MQRQVWIVFGERLTEMIVVQFLDTPEFCIIFKNIFSIGDGQTFVVTWTTLSPTTSSVVGSIVEFGSDPENLENSVHGTEEVFTDGGYEKRKEYIHRVIFPKLTPKKRYCKS